MPLTRETVLLPVADGGDGTLHALVDATGGEVFTSRVTGPLGQPIEAMWGVMGDGRTAVIEMALASGLALVPQRRRNPRITTTAGTGEIMREALERGYTRIIVGLGGSATNDGGAGFAAALGARFLDGEDRPIPPGGSALARLQRIDITGLHSQLSDASIIAATDVTNPLCGPDGASAVFGPQKGANQDMVEELDDALSSYARVVARDVGKDVAEEPGAGAAGGLGAGLMAFAGATLQSGIDMVCEVLNFDAILKDADLVITGEGTSRQVNDLQQGAGGSGPPGRALRCSDRVAGWQPGSGIRGVVRSRPRRCGEHRGPADELRPIPVAKCRTPGKRSRMHHEADTYRKEDGRVKQRATT